MACCSAFQAGCEENPWKSLSYTIFIVQFMFITLDLFMDTSLSAGWHYSITSIELVVAVAITFYQFYRILSLTPICGKRHKYKPALLLSASLLLQLAVVGIAGYSFRRNSDAAEWTMFGISLAWGIVNPMTYEAVAAARQAESDGDGEDKKKRLGPGAAIISVFTKHFTRTPLLFVTGTLFAIAQAILGTYQGAVINELTKAVTKKNDFGDLTATADDVEKLAFTLVLVWASASLARFIFDVLSSLMFSRLEIWLRGSVFDQAVSQTHHGSQKSLTLADYQARYASDVTGVVDLYGTLLRGVVVNLLLICTNFVFLAINEWRVATVTLGFLAMGVTSGPTDLAGEAAADVQEDVTNGLALMSSQQSTKESNEASAPQQDGPVEDNPDLVERHRTEVLVPLKKHVFRKSFFSNAVDTFNNFFSSFLTAVVVITMSWNVFHEEMDSSEFLGIFFVFKQLQKPATKFSGVIKKAVSKAANLERINGVVFGTDGAEDDQNDGAGNDGSVDLKSANEENVEQVVQGQSADHGLSVNREAEEAKEPGYESESSLV